MRLAAGDFNYTMIDNATGYYTYQEGNNVEIAYSLYNQNDWTELNLTKIPEFFLMPAFGDYYEASLHGIGTSEGNAWYDLKIISIDGAGNTQQQIISPAFKVSDKLGVDEITESTFAVYPNPFSEQLNIVLPDTVKGNYTFSMSDMSGRRIYSKNQSEKSFHWNTTGLPKGVYVISIEYNGKVLSKKVVRRY